MAGNVPEVPKDPIKAAEKTLRDAKIGTDTKSLIEFFGGGPRFRKTIAYKLLTTIRRLGDDDFDIREEASEELTKAGLAALPILPHRWSRQERRGRPPSRNLLAKNQSRTEPPHILAAATLFAHQKADNAVGILAGLSSLCPRR